MEAVTDCILRGHDVDAHIYHLTDAGHAAGAGFLVNAHDGESLGVGAHIHIRLLQHLHYLNGMSLILVGDSGAVAAGHASLPAPLHRQPGGVLQCAVEHIFGLVNVHIHQSAVLFRHLKADIHVLAGVLVQHFGGRHSAYDIAAHIHGLLHQLFGTGIADKALLREGDELQVADILGGFLGHQQALYGVQVGVQGADIDVGTELGGAVHHAFADGAGRAGGNVLRGIFADPLVHHIDGILQRFLGGRDPVLLAEALAALLVRGVGFIEVHVGIDKGRAGHLAGRVDGFNAGRALDMLGNLLVFSIIANEYVDDFSGSVQVSVFDQ